MKKKLAILASGAGSNAHNIIRYFANSEGAEVTIVASNRKEAGVLDIARSCRIDTFLLTRENFRETREFLQLLKKLKIDFIILAGFLWQVPKHLVEAYDRRIINIHPALLPSYGGKGMYGHHVHEAVHAAGEKESGITIHYVDEHYDEGDIIFQARVNVHPEDSPHVIERKVRALEIEHFPRIIASLVEEA